MAVLELENQQLTKDHHRLSARRARVEVSWPDGCTRFDLRNEAIKAEVEAVVEVPKDASPLRAGSVWSLRLTRKGRNCRLDLLALTQSQSVAGPNKFRRLHTWNFLIVGYSTDPHDLFPKPSFLKEAAEEKDQPATINLAELVGFLQDELGELPSATFDSEGGFH